MNWIVLTLEIPMYFDQRMHAQLLEEKKDQVS